MLESVGPLPPDLAMWSKLSPLALKNLVDREFNGLLSKFPTDGAKLMKQESTSSVCPEEL